MTIECRLCATWSRQTLCGVSTRHQSGMVHSTCLVSGWNTTPFAFLLPKLTLPNASSVVQYLPSGTRYFGPYSKAPNTPFTRYNRLSHRLYPVWQPCWTNNCSFNRLSNRVVQPVWQPAVYTIQPVVKPVVKRVWQPVECLYTRYNQLYCVYKHLRGCQAGLTTGLTTGCIV